MKKILLSLFSLLLCLFGCGNESLTNDQNIAFNDDYQFDYEAIEAYDGLPYVELNNNMPAFDESD